MRKTLLASALVVALAALTHAQAEFAGKWMGETQGRGGGTQEITLNLMVKGDMVMGTITQGQQGEAEISDGKVVDDHTITFMRSVEGRGGNAFTLNYTGMLKGEELVLTIEFPGRGGGGGGGRGGPAPIMLKRVE